jgi:hypothetical protein
MKYELAAYLIHDDGEVSDMPTGELLVAIDHLMQAGISQGQSLSSDKAVVYEFLQTLKRTMQTSRDVGQVSTKGKGEEMGNMTREGVE